MMAGVLIGHVGASFSPEPAATATAVAAALLPDFDFYARKYEGSRFLKIHHGVTHSLLGLVIQTGITAGASWFFFRFITIRFFQPASFTLLLLISLLSVLTHILLDWIMHNNGLPLLWPLSARRFCLPLILGVNPKTVSHDCGEKRYFTCFGCQSRGGFLNPVSWILIVPAVLGFFTPEWRTEAGLIPWILAAGYLTLCYVFRESARGIAGKLDPCCRTADAYPARSRPDRWLFVCETGEMINAILADCVKRCVMRRWQYRRIPLQPEVAKAVDRIHRDLQDTIRHLYPLEIPVPEGMLVEFRDLSYLSAEPLEIGTVRAYLDPSFRLTWEVYQEVW